MCDRCPTKSKLAYVASPAVLIAAVVLFFGNYTYSFVFCQTLVALAFVLLFWQMYNHTSPYNAIRESSNWFIRWICRFGKLSFPIYLTHSFVAYEFSIISLKILTSIYDNSVLWYFVLLPVMLCLSYVIGFLFNKIILYASRITGIGRSGR